MGNEAAQELRGSAGDAGRARRALKKCFTRMMNCEKKVFVDQLNMLVKRVTEEGERTASPGSQMSTFWLISKTVSYFICAYVLIQTLFFFFGTTILKVKIL